MRKIYIISCWRLAIFDCKSPLLAIRLSLSRAIWVAVRTVWQITGDTSTALFGGLNFQTAAKQLRAIIHDVESEALLQSRLTGKSDAVIDYAQDHFLPRSL